MKWRYGIVKTYPEGNNDPEFVLCEIYFEKNPEEVIAYSDGGTRIWTDDLRDPCQSVVQQLENALRDCKKYPIFDSRSLKED